MGNTTVTIQAMRSSDIPGALRLWNRSPGTSTNDTPAEIRRYLRRNPGGSFVAVADGRLVGAVLGGHDGRRGSIWHLAVLPAHRRDGLGRVLVGRAVEVLRREGIRKINILVRSDNQGALRFWRRIGWTRYDVANFSIRPRKR